MAKVIERDGKHYRIRRGKEVEIPAEWVGKTVSKQTINKRPSKQPHKIRKELKLLKKHFKLNKQLLE